MIITGKNTGVHRSIRKCAQASDRAIQNHFGRVRIALLLLVTSLTVVAADSATLKHGAAEPSPADLTLSNFLSVGWNEPWTRRSRGAGTPDLSLLRVQTNFLAQLIRTDYASQVNLTEAGTHGTDSLSGILEHAFNRRFMLALIGNYRWVDSRAGEDLEGAAAGAFVRFHWVDTATSSIATTLRVGMPSHELGEQNTTLSFAIAGWQDLAPLGLSRVGIYYHVLEETLAGPSKAGRRRNDLTYALAVAKTWTSPESLLGNFTTFLEGHGKTDLDGTDRGHTLVTLTPGVRATLVHRHIVMAGVDFPFTEPRPYERIVRLTYIYNF